MQQNKEGERRGEGRGEERRKEEGKEGKRERRRGTEERRAGRGEERKGFVRVKSCGWGLCRGNSSIEDHEANDMFSEFPTEDQNVL